eukprot:CAMPEP_0170552404 /NCGR_PEP_ID=MMETSP0211-20121228/10302_1 /TAXON_ID=311385 /ORGANISM="Pseudokeronopsis sp., Strain OXSARD2" /LENGTH=141 /DNA_ID=CAMNT_0010860111 /DNA_START=429 /DNA_END=853 /DNA_ORIENTATION=-
MKRSTKLRSSILNKPTIKKKSKEANFSAFTRTIFYYKQDIAFIDYDLQVEENSFKHSTYQGKWELKDKKNEREQHSASEIIEFFAVDALEEREKGEKNQVGRERNENQSSIVVIELKGRPDVYDLLKKLAFLVLLELVVGV